MGKILLAAGLAFAVAQPVPGQSSQRPVFEFDGQDPTGNWYIVNDSVMGGVSTGGGVIESGRLVFRGSVSLRNNGGFASVRSAPADLGLSGARSLRIRILGDGKTYRLRVRTGSGWDGVAYDAPVPTKPGQWTEHQVSIQEMVPRFRGRAVRSAQKLDPSQIRSVTLMVTDKQTGPFEVQVDWIRAETVG
jgi:monofunctional biosynthetic peptidoglycan transglycosylase